METNIASVPNTQATAEQLIAANLVRDELYQEDFRLLNESMQEGLSAAIAKDVLFFETQHGYMLDYPNEHGRIEGIFQQYLDAVNINPGDKVYHRCVCCKHYIERYAALVTLDAENQYQATSVMWHPEKLDANNHYYPLVVKMKELVEAQPVMAVFTEEKTNWGKPEWGGFHHLAVDGTGYKGIVDEGDAEGLANNFKAMAKQIRDGLHDDAIQAEYARVNTLVAANAIWGVDKLRHYGELTAKYHALPKKDQKTNFTYYHAVTGPAGFAGYRNGVFGALCIDLKKGPTLEVAIGKHNARMDPSKYRQMEKEASLQSIMQAQKLFKEKNAEKSLEWTAAQVEDLRDFHWVAKATAIEEAVSTSPFDKLIEKKAAVTKMPTILPNQSMGWVRFARDLMPKADRIVLTIPTQYVTHPIMYFTKMVHPESAPILQWDLPEKRFPVSAWAFAKGTAMRATSLAGQHQIEVTHIAKGVSEQSGNHREGNALQAIFILKDFYLTEPALQTFTPIIPETVKSEFNPVMRAIQDYCHATPMDNFKGAAGMAINSLQKEANIQLMVHVGDVCHTITIDRWE